MMSNFSGFEQADSACKSAERIRKNVIQQTKQHAND
jgi:hypothetical protein